MLVYMERQRRRPVHRQPTGWVGTEKLCRRVHQEATERVLFIGSQPAWTEQPTETRPGVLDGNADRNEAWGTAERRKRPCVRPPTVETGSCSPEGVWRTTKRRKRTSLGPPTVETGSC